MSKKIVIIGPGSIGSSIAKEVKDDGFEPFLVGRNFSALKNYQRRLVVNLLKQTLIIVMSLLKLLVNAVMTFMG